MKSDNKEGMYSDSMDDPMLCLSWNDHMDNILNVFMEQLTSESLVDVTIMCEGRFIKAHKMVLSACSPYLHEILTMHNVPDPVIIMNNVKFSDMKLVVDFMYCGQIKVSKEDFRNVVSLAQSLQIKGLSSDDDSQGAEPESCVQPIIQESSSFSLNKRIYEKNSSNGRAGRRKKRPIQNKPTVPKYQQIPVGKPINQDIKIEPADADKSGSRCPTEDSNSNYEEYQQWSEEEDRKPDRMILDYLRISSENSASGLSEKNVSPISSRAKHDSFTEWPSDENSSEISRTESNTENWSRPHHNPDVDRIRRPPNAFMIFSNEWRKKLSKIYPFETNAELSRRLGEMWNSLEQKDKDVYFMAARLADQEHKEKYPFYHYSPKGRPRKRNQAPPEKPVGMPCIKFAKVFLTSENESIPVLIALNNPERPWSEDNHLEKAESGGKKRETKRSRNVHETTSE